MPWGLCRATGGVALEALRLERRPAALGAGQPTSASRAAAAPWPEPAGLELEAQQAPARRAMRCRQKPPRLRAALIRDVFFIVCILNFAFCISAYAFMRASAIPHTALRARPAPSSLPAPSTTRAPTRGSRPRTIAMKNSASAASRRSLKIMRAAVGLRRARERLRVRQEAELRIGREHLLPAGGQRRRRQPRQRHAAAPTRSACLPIFTSTVVATHSATAASSWLAMPNSGHSELMPPSGSITP